MTERRRLVREESVKPHARNEEARGERASGRLFSSVPPPRDDEDERDFSSAPRGARAPRTRGGWTRGRPPLSQDFGDIGRGSVFVGIESAAIALDTLARVLRGAVDRAFDEDYDRPGDVVRGVANEADLAAYDLATELRGVPRRLARRFDESIRSPRADRGERERRADAARNGEPRPGGRSRARDRED